jgi:hypothetical protein
MYQTIQCTGLSWTLHLHKVGGVSHRLAYGSFDAISDHILPQIPIKVLPDGVYVTYMTAIRKLSNHGV